MKERVLVIIPAYNEEASIRRVVQRLRSCAPDMDYIIVNDGSLDGTQQIMKQEAYRGITLPVNMGIGASVQTGYQYARDMGYSIAVQLDGDGQHNPEYIKQLIQPIVMGTADLCIGSRFVRKEGFQSTRMRRAGISVLHHVAKVFSGVSVRDMTSGFRACSRELIELFAREYPEDYPEPETVVMAHRNGFRVVEVPVMMDERTGGKSSIAGLSSAYYMIKVIISILLSSMRGKERKRA